MKVTPPCHQGQGVVEYAGALVVCAILLAAAMSLVPYNMETMFTQVTNKAISSIMGN